MLRVISIFTSISGEVGGFPQGAITQFVRFGGCNLTCHYCDTKASQDMKSGQEMQVKEIVNILLGNGIKNVILTGGEPLIQHHDDLVQLVASLNHHNFRVSIETNGTARIPLILRRYCSFVMDYKLDIPEFMNDINFLDLGGDDFVKFPIADMYRLKQAIEIQRRLYSRGCLAKFAYSPIFDRSGGNAIGFDQTACSQACLSIIKELIASKIDAVLNLQIHKVIQAE